MLIFLVLFLVTGNCIVQALSHGELAQINMVTMGDLMNRYYANPEKHAFGVIAGSPLSSVVTIPVENVEQALAMILPTDKCIETVYVDNVNNAGLIEALQKHGFIVSSQKPCMHIFLDSIADSLILPDKFVVKASSDPEFSFDEWASGEHAGFSGCIERFKRWSAEDKAIFYTGYLDGKAVARQMLYRYGKVLQQYFGQTDKEYRCKGYARVLLLQALLQHKKLGYELCTNQVTQNGFDFSKAIGFEQHSVMFELDRPQTESE